LYHSLGGREADLELPAETVGSELLYMANDPWERCFRAFALGDYIGCQVEAQSIIVKTAAIQHPKVRLLLLISLQRTDQAERAHDLATNVMLPKLNELFWLYALIQLTVGLADPEKVAAQALNDVELCQVNFYAGERFLTDNQESAAVEAFKACAAINVECDERFLALAELNPQNRAPIASLFQLSLRAEGFEKAGDVAQAAALLNNAHELAEQYLGETDFATQSLARRLVQLIDSGEA